MILPDKLFSYNESVLSKFPIVLRELKKSSVDAAELYHAVKNKMADVSEFIEVLDCLYVLGKIEYDSDAELLRYVS